MRSSVIARSTIAVASAFLVLSACGPTSPPAGEDDADSQTQEQGVPDNGSGAGENRESSERSETSENGQSGEDDAAEDSSGEQSPGRTADGECIVGEGSSEIPSGPPEVDEWAMVAGTAAPVSERYGPYAQDGDLWTCYEHSANGALFASAYFLSASGRVEGVSGEWLPEGDFRDEAIASEEEGLQDSEELTVTLIGYRFQTYTEESAIIDLVVEGALPEGTANISMRVALKWDRDRWAADPENFGEQGHAVESLDGYSPWRG
ncbi:MAG: hypothetical protein DI611_13270 [Brachybacterium faecium]|nr:MAG: hypothetical protein DI611_13270 [Brachybacterium faecium]